MPNPLNATAARSLAERTNLLERCTLQPETLQAEYERICETPAGETFTAKAARLARLYTLVVTHGCGSDAEAV